MPDKSRIEAAQAEARAFRGVLATWFACPEEGQDCGFSSWTSQSRLEQNRGQAVELVMRRQDGRFGLCILFNSF